MTVTVTGTAKDVTGHPDNAEWTFSSVLREGSDGSVITTRTRTVKPINGHFSVNLDPGLAIVEYAGETWTVTIPNTTADIWDLIEIAVGAPPDTGVDALAAAIAAYFSAHPIAVDGGAL